MAMAPPRVVLVDDHHLFRSGVRAELGDQVSVVAEADDVAAAVAAIEQWRPDVVLLDVHLPSGTGREVIEALQGTDVETRFLALSVSDAEEDVIDVVRAGARGYVTKSISAARGSARGRGSPTNVFTGRTPANSSKRSRRSSWGAISVPSG